MDDIITHYDEPKIPKIVFIVPYRNRPQHKFFFTSYIRAIMTHTDYEIYFSHQCDARAFNRGATKNIGFLAVKRKYPNNYKDITFIFNDIDTVPYCDMLNFATTHGTVKHFYGFKYALGGIVSLTGSDFELTNGYPNYWGWGMEDNVLQTRCEKKQLTIDRNQFYPIGSPHIIHLFDGVQRIINKKDPWRATNDDGIDGLRTIHKLKFTINTSSLNNNDNNIDAFDNVFIINITTFMTANRFEHDNYHHYDLREPARKIMHPDRIPTVKINHLTDDWSNIPYYPDAQTKQEMINKYGTTQTEKIIKYNYENSSEPNKNGSVPTNQNCEILPPEPHKQDYVPRPPPPPQQTQLLRDTNKPSFNQNPRPPSNPNPNPNIYYSQAPHPSAHKYSPAYSRVIGAKSRATPTANIRMGGVY